MAATIATPTVEDRVLDAGSRCIARWGVAKTTLDDVAREAACSRATIYRIFPGGRDALLRRLVQREAATFFGELDTLLLTADSLEALVEEGMSAATARLAAHPVLQYALRHESAVLPSWQSSELALAHQAAAAWLADHLARFLAPDRTDVTADWLVRVVFALVQCPSPHFDPTDPDTVTRLARTFVLPGLTRLLEEPPT